MKRLPTDITGVVSYEGIGISNANISFSPIMDISYSLNFTTDENGNLSNVILPPDNYVYTFSYNDNGTRYFALGQIDIKIGQSSLDLGTINAEKKYDISGLATLNDISENGIVIFTPVSDLDNETTFEVTKSGGYSGSLVGGNYYVSFQDGLKNEHYSFSEIMNINMPKEYNLTLKDEGFFSPGVPISSKSNLILLRSSREFKKSLYFFMTII